MSDSPSATEQGRPLPAPESCPLFNTCNASVCPLAPDEGIHVTDEAVCFYLRQSGKAGADAYFAARPNEPTYTACKLALPVLAAKYPDIGRRVERASRSPIQGSRRQGFLGSHGENPVAGVDTGGEDRSR
jgi:hypothetical protein